MFDAKLMHNGDTAKFPPHIFIFSAQTLGSQLRLLGEVENKMGDMGVFIEKNKLDYYEKFS